MRSVAHTLSVFISENTELELIKKWIFNLLEIEAFGKMDIQETLEHGIVSVLKFSFWMFLLFGLAYPLDLVSGTRAFIICYMPLRATTGGAHAKSDAACLLLSIFFPLAVAYVNRFLIIHVEISYFIFALTFTVLLKYGAIDNSEKEIDESILRFMKWVGIIVLTILFAVMTHTEEWRNIISLVVILTSFNLMIGKYQKSFKKNRCE